MVMRRRSLALSAFTSREDENRDTPPEVHNEVVRYDCEEDIFARTMSLL
jgi:hypothetical protein